MGEKRAVRIMDDSADSGNRVTVAIVYRAVDDLSRTVNAHFDGVKQRLDRLDGAPERLARVEERLTDVEKVQEMDAERSRFWRRHGLTLTLSLVMSAPGWVALFLKTSP